MAEFQEVMREWVRSRKTINENKLSCCPLEMFTDDYIANIEKEVMSWAAEHPEPVYPTWFEWLEEQGVAGAINGEPYYTSTDREVYLKQPAFTPKAFAPVPADIAQKLGLKEQGGEP